MSPKPTVLVTGCNGFIGSRLAPALTKEGFKTFGIDKWSREFEGLEILESGGVSELSIIHLAGLSDAGSCQKDRQLAFDMNAGLLKKTLQALNRFKVNKVVLASTALVYGTKHKGLVTEDSEARPENIYAESKLAAEKIISSLPAGKGISVRLSNVYGEGMGSSTMMAEAVSQIKNGSLSLREYSSVRDYLYIDDAVGAFIACLKGNAHYNIYNSGTSKGYSVYEVAKMIAESLGKKEAVSGIKLPSSGQAGSLVLSHERIKNDLSWEAKVGIREGICRLIKE